MDEIKLRYFTSVARHLSFTKAAEDQHVVQATISKQIAALEKELGVALFFRDHQTVRLTPAGERLAADADDYAERYREINASVQNLTLEFDKKLRIGMGPYEYTLVTEPLRLFTERYPNVEIICTTYTYQRLVSHLRSGTIDVGFGLGSCVEAVKGLIAIPLLQERWIIAAGTESRFWALPSPQRAVLDGQIVITLFANTYEPVRPHCVRNNFRPSAFTISNQMLPQLTMVRSGLGVALMPEHLRDAVSGGLRWDAEGLSAPLRQTVFVCYNPILHSTAAAHFLECCRECYPQMGLAALSV